MLPNFFVIGAAKSGTTSLHDYLGQHPQICMSVVKELNFFSFLGTSPEFNGPDLAFDGSFLRDRRQLGKYGRLIASWKDYERQFDHARDEIAIGESSVSYMYFAEAARNIKENIPEPKFVAILRNPVDRAFSKYCQYVRDAREPLRDFDQALAAEDDRKRDNWPPAWFYKDRGFYCRQLKVYYDLFDRQQIHIALYEDFCADPKGVCREIFHFLGVDQAFEIDDRERRNVSRSGMVARNPALHRLIMEPNLVSNLVRRVTPGPLLKHVRRAALALSMARQREDERPVLRAKTRESLKRLFKDDIEQLSMLIGKDLRHWL